jgi:hypothetical protein
MLSGHVVTIALMPSEGVSAGGSRYQVLYPEWTEEQSRQWVAAWTTLCIETYLEAKGLPRLPSSSKRR